MTAADRTVTDRTRTATGGTAADRTVADKTEAATDGMIMDGTVVNRGGASTSFARPQVNIFEFRIALTFLHSSYLSKRPRCDSHSHVYVSPIFVSFHLSPLTHLPPDLIL